MAERYLAEIIRQDLREKMVLLAGPRQVGKTTLAKQLSPPAGYLSYDIPRDRQRILRRELPPSGVVWVFDELHRFRGWRNWLKGVVDEFGRTQPILVTGSGRLDAYRFGGDSLQGRYHFWRMHPLSLAELAGGNDAALQLFKLGGFPEPFFSGSERSAARWSQDYRDRLMKEEVASLERVSDLGRLELLTLSLPERVGSPLSLNALREDLSVAHLTIQRWLAVLERLYAVYFLPPFGAPKLRAVKKEQKHYHWDWSLVKSPGARFENMVAGHLLKWVHFQRDSEGRDLELRYFRDVTGREIDFVVTEARKPIMVVEAKLSNEPISPALEYFVARYPKVPAYQVSLHGTRDATHRQGIRAIPFASWAQTLV